jgi:hypothetical protein
MAGERDRKRALQIIREYLKPGTRLASEALLGRR